MVRNLRGEYVIKDTQQPPAIGLEVIATFVLGIYMEDLEWDIKHSKYMILDLILFQYTKILVHLAFVVHLNSSLLPAFSSLLTSFFNLFQTTQKYRPSLVAIIKF